MYKNSTIVGIPPNYSFLSSSQCIASCETSLAFYLHPKKETKNLWGWSTMSLIGGGRNFVTSMRRSSQDNFCGKNSQKAIKYSQSYDVVCHLALLGSKGLRLLPTFAGGLREKIRTCAGFNKIPTNYISEESLINGVYD